MRKFLAEMLQRPGIGQEIARTLGYEPPVDSLVAEHFQLIYRNNLLIDRAVDEIMAVQNLAINPVSAREMGREIGAVLIAKLIASGLRRLPAEQQKRFFDYYSQIPAKLSDAECRAMFNVSTSDTTLEFKAVARISPEALREYLAIIREAVGAELAGTSPVPDLNIRQKQIADDAAQAVTFKALAGLSEAERMSIAQAIAKSDGSPEACRGYRLIFPPLFQMPGIVGDWLRADSLKNMGTGL